MAKSIVVIGGAHGGPRAASRARQFDENAHIILLERGPHVTWVQADLRYHLEGDLSRLEQRLIEREQYFAKRYKIDIRVNTEAIAIDMEARCVIVKKGDTTERIRFDSVIFAGGAVSKPVNVDGLEGPWASYGRNLFDIKKIKTAIENGAKKAVVLGGGLYGIEAAEGLRASGLAVDLVEQAPRLASKYSLPVAYSIKKKLIEFGTRVFTSDTVVKAVPRKKMGFDLQLASGTLLEADLVVIAIGSQPRAQLLAQAGAALYADGSVRVDNQMATTLPNIYACGSAVCVPQAITHERIWMPQPAIIERTAQIAGHNAVAQDSQKESFKAISGTQLLRVGDSWFARTGLCNGDARKFLGDDRFLMSTVHSRSAEVWYGEEEMTINLIVDKKEGKIAGGEVWGKKGVERRIDLLSAAVIEGWSATKLVDLDMAYSASLGPSFDSLKEAGLTASLHLNDESKALSGEKLAMWVTQQKPFTLVDVSVDAEAVDTKGAVKRMPLEQLRDRIEEFDRNLPIVLTSRSGKRAMLAQRVLQQRGFQEVYHLNGGSITWSMLVENSTPVGQ